MYTGEKVRLRELCKEDITPAQQFVNDPEVKRLLNPGIPYPVTLEDEQKWFENNTASKAEYNFAVETLVEQKYIGCCGVNQVDWKNSIAVIGIMIGDREHQGRGFGTDALKVLIRFIFEQLNLHKVKVEVFSFNERAICSYEKCGFRKEGVLRQELFRDGSYHDIIVMGILRDEYAVVTGELSGQPVPPQIRQETL